MALTVEFQDHETFHKEFLRMGAAGLAASLACHLLAPAIDSAAPWPLAVVGSAVVLAAAWPRLVRSSRASVLATALLILLAVVLLVSDASQWPLALTGAALCAGAVAVRGLRGRSLAFAVAAAAPLLAIAAVVFARLGIAEIFASLPGAVPAAAAGLGFAAVAIVTQLPRHVLIVRDRVGAAHASMAPRAQGEVKELADRGLALWRKTEASLPVTDANRKLLEEAVLRLFDVAGRWTVVETESAQAAPDALGERIAELSSRMESATDSVVKSEYAAARDALREQLRYLDDIGASRERVLARMHNYLAAMERLNLALVNVKSTSASREAVDVQPMVESLADLGRDIDALGEALDA